jgi:hypothetical protein
VRDLARAYPGAVFNVEGGAVAEIFAFDSRLSPTAPAGAVTLPLDTKPTIDASGADPSRRYVFALHDAFEAATGLTLPRDRPYPDLVLGPDELTPPYPQPYAVCAAGGKTDVPLKMAPLATFAGAVRATADRWRWFQVGALRPEGAVRHIQEFVPGCDPLLGRTTLRELIRLVAHAAVVLCHLSLPMVVASSFGVPCVSLLGGRETPTLFDGMGVDLLHAIGRLPCCAAAGCYRRVAVAPHADSPLPPNWVCVDPVVPPHDAAVGRCMTLWSGEDVAARLVAAAAKGRRRTLALSPDGDGPSPAVRAGFSSSLQECGP